MICRGSSSRLLLPLSIALLLLTGIRNQPSIWVIVESSRTSSAPRGISTTAKPHQVTGVNPSDVLSSTHYRDILITAEINNSSKIREQEDWEGLMDSVLPVVRNTTRSCTLGIRQPHPCVCDPFIPSNKSATRWLNHHDNLASTSLSAPHDLDVLFLGDSITEKWNGTKYLGKGLHLERRAAFQEQFSKAQGSQFQGLALGASGDRAQDLNWHVQNGWIASESLNPKVIWILVGTNNLSIECSTADIVVSSILEVAFQIRKRKPKVSIVIQGLLPRGDTLGSFELGNTWKTIQNVNRQLASLCEMRFSGLYYTEFDQMKFLVKKWPFGRRIHKRLMSDGTHPTAEGYGLLGKHAESVIRHILSV